MLGNKQANAVHLWLFDSINLNYLLLTILFLCIFSEDVRGEARLFFQRRNWQVKDAVGAIKGAAGLDDETQT